MSDEIHIIGISAYFHDSAAALLSDGEIVAAAQEERFTRIKGDPSFPHHATAYCLETAGLHENDVDHYVFYENPLVKFERLITTYHLTAPNSLKSYLRALPQWLTTNLWLEKEIQSELGTQKRISFSDHHLSHAASAFYPSPFEEAAILTVDGVGEWSTITLGIGKHNQIELLKEIRFPNSVGLLYSAFTYFTGFKINSGEYKLMGLAPYGKPIYVERILDKLINLQEDGAIQLNQRYFDYIGGQTMTNDLFADLFDGPPREPEAPITQREMDIAASIQEILNRVVLKLADFAKAQTGMANLVMAGGVALNVVSTGLLARKKTFDRVWIQPAAGDAGGALGAAQWFWHMLLDRPRQVAYPDGMAGSFLGPDIDAVTKSSDVTLKAMGGVWAELDDATLSKKVANLIAEGNVVGLARGRMEWGPRALGARSIIGDARSAKMQSHMNLKIKYRESFRPFAPMVLVDDAKDYFEVTDESPYMLFAHPVVQARRRIPGEKEKNLWGIDLLKVPRSDIPAVTHVDYSARVQTVDKLRNAFIHEVLRSFRELTGCSVIINTSFNVRGEPIVCTAADAYRCFMMTDIDYLVLGNRLFNRDEQQSADQYEQQRQEWLASFDLD